MIFLAVTGADACGKDTQIKYLATELESQGKRVHVSGIWDSLSLFAGVTEPRQRQKILEVFLLDFEPLARTLFLQSLLRNSLALIPEDAHVVILNGSHYKYQASEQAYGVSAKEWAERDLVPRPDLIFHLKTTPEICETRRTSWTRYESGEAKSLQSAPLTRLRFQRDMHQALDQILGEEPKVVTVDAGQDPVQVFNSIREALRGQGFWD